MAVSAAIGKNVGDDFRERKLTLPVIKAVAKADAEERAFWTRVIEKGDQRDGDLEHAMGLLARHGSDGGDAGRGDRLGRQGEGGDSEPAGGPDPRHAA